MEMRVERTSFTQSSTIGKLFIDGRFECFTLEDCCREGDIHTVKIPGQTAIPPGRYEVIVDRSTRFKRDLPRLLNVPAFEGVRIHPGNTAAETEGCILVGSAQAAETITESKKAFEALFAKIQRALAAGESVRIEVVGQPGAPRAPIPPQAP